MVEQVLQGIKKLSLQKGDVLILNQQAAMWFSMLPKDVMDDWVRQLGFEVPVIIGEASKLSRSDLVRMLENAPE